ncbi:helix-turn-helix domain-containing protein [Macrococcus equipercicus]|uniref:Helix-turn-helix transcriptional regulator n=1 Tax=Macrococcus equipercicus TaxID=69967 RepID=A0A9Q9BLR6_9STAP|nr:helix-turn-helix transcriptional regulator [Macrococcus equipercicus]UTH13878.1 helix-turn-helix transcriptional regulator [Macrococcus equipercicus]
MDVGNQIRYYRKEQNLSQMELAEKIFVSSQTISNWENERSYPDLHNLIELATLFDVSLDQLVKGDVKVMRNAVDHSKMDEYGKLMLIFTLLSALAFGAAVKFSEGWFGFLIPFLLWGISFYYASKIERLKNKYDVKTYKEILDYMENGVKTNSTPRDNKKYIKEKIIIVLSFTAIFGILALLSFVLFQLF